ncbi:MFS transporter [Nonomuraea fuscirosea]|uniref:MFS transporter n=1 Tax=Nonomuraea fuscirosea TaxID=1291556 RepID=UPI0034092AD2
MTTTLAPPPVGIGKAAVGALCLLAIATGALESVLTPTLPLLQRELALSPAQGALLSTALLISGALLLPVSGTLGDRYGGRRVMTRLMIVVLAGGLVSSLAPNLPVLLAGQILQGAMVGALPLSFILVRKHLPPGSAHTAIGVVSGMFVGGNLVGSMIAGPIAEGLSRHWMFAIPTLAIAVGTVLVHRLIPDDPPARSDARIDWPGLVLLSGALLTLMLVLPMVPEAGGRPLEFGALLLLLAGLVIGWIRVERRSAAPMVDLRLLARPGMWSSYAITFAVCLGTAASMYLVPQLFAVPTDAYGFGASASDMGLYLLPSAVAAAVSGPIAGFAARRFGARTAVAAGIAGTVATLAALALLHGEVWHLVIGKVLISLASGICVTAVVVKTATTGDGGDTGTATSLILVTRVIGFTAGAQLGGILLTAMTPSGANIPDESAFIIGFGIASAVTALALLAVRTLNRGEEQ